MWKYILKRLVMMIPVLLGVLILVFALNELSPGDPATQLAGENATEAAIEAIREELGLNKPIIQRFVDYVYGIITKFDLGTSYQSRQPVTTEIMERFPTTALLQSSAASIGLPAGIISATKQYSWFDPDCHRGFHDWRVHAKLLAGPHEYPGLLHCSGMVAGLRLLRARILDHAGTYHWYQLSRHNLPDDPVQHAGGGAARTISARLVLRDRRKEKSFSSIF